MIHELEPDIEDCIRRALEEDIGSGDATTLSTIPIDLALQGTFLAKSDGTIAGLDVARRVFELLDPAVEFDSRIVDGQEVRSGDIFAAVAGPGRTILTGERTALNFLQRMSGIATLTRAFVQAVEGTRAIILDTRKTAPGLRSLDKLSVRLGGGTNHRVGLFDMVLVKDNHIEAAGGITAAVRRVKSGSASPLPVEVECRTLKDVQEAYALSVDRIMLDNMDLATIDEAVRVVAGRIPLEVSGNVTLETVRSIAKTGVDLISVGALTHSVKAMDISLKIKAVVHEK